MISLLSMLYLYLYKIPQLVNDYLRDSYYSQQQIIRDVSELNVVACRLMWVILPGLEVSAVFQVLVNNGVFIERVNVMI